MAWEGAALGAINPQGKAGVVPLDDLGVEGGDRGKQNGCQDQQRANGCPKHGCWW